MKQKKIAAFICALLLLFISLGGCSKEKPDPEVTLDSLFSAVKTSDLDTMLSFLNLDDKKAEQIKQNWSGAVGEAVTNANSILSYQVTKKSLGNESAALTVQVKGGDMVQITEKALDLYVQMTGNWLQEHNAEEYTIAESGQMLSRSFKEASDPADMPTYETEITVRFQWENGKWNVLADTTLLDVLTANISKTQGFGF